ncbi:MAG: hypothetical protein IKA36_04645 [Clostridia bacterium]|nr:hypothetical protein [Clostridia bacterium]
MANITYKEIKTKSITDTLFLHIKDGDVIKYVSIQDLAIQEGKGMIGIDSLSKLKKANTEGRLFTKKSNGAKDRQIVLVDANFYEREVHNEFAENGSGFFISTTIQGNKDVPAGCQRALRIKTNSDGKQIGIKKKKDKDHLEEREYLLVTLSNGDTKYLSRNEIVSSKSKRPFGARELSNLADGKKFNIEDLEGNRIEKVDITQAYMFENATVTDKKLPARETFDGHRHITLKTDKNGNIEEETEIIDNVYTEQRYLKDEKKPIIRITNYESNRNENGDFVKVVFAGEYTETLLDKKELFLDSGLTKPVTNFSDMVGKVLFSKSNDDATHFRVTQPISAIQANYTYTKKQYLQETDKKEDIYSPNTYLKLESGSYVKETESVRPICYEYTKLDETPEVYLANVVDAVKGDISIIIPASAVKKKNKSETFKYGYYTISKDKIFGLKKSNKRMADCDVIQTSTEQDKHQSCQVLRTVQKYDETTKEAIRVNKANIQDILKQVGDEFLRDYKEGKYIINEVLNANGEYEMIIRGKRFVFTDHLDLPDYSNGYSEYSCIKPDGQYNLGAGLKKSFKKWGKKTWERGYKAYLIGWPLLVMSPVLGGLFLGAIAASALAVPISEIAKAGKVNSANTLLKDKTKCVSKLNKKDIFIELKIEYEKAIKKGNNFTKEDQSRFLERMEKLEAQTSQLAGGKTIADFEIKGGKKTPIDESNIEEYKIFKVEMQKEEADLKKLLKDMKRGKITRDEYNAKFDEHQKHLYNYVAKGVIKPKDEKYQEIIDAINTVKGFVIAKQGEMPKVRKKVSQQRQAEIKESVVDKELKIGKDFKCTIGKIKKEENDKIISDLIDVASETRVNYDEVITHSYHSGMNDEKERKKPQPKAKEEEAVATHEDVKTETKIAGLDFEIAVYKEVEKASKTNPGATEISFKPVGVVEETLSANSVKNIRKAIKLLETDNVRENDRKLVKKYIKTNLENFLNIKGLKKEQEERLKKIAESYNDVIQKEKEAKKQSQEEAEKNKESTSTK